MKGNELFAALGKDFTIVGKSFGFDVAKNKTDDDITLNESYGCLEDIPEFSDLVKSNVQDAVRTRKEHDSLVRTLIKRVNNARNTRANQNNTKVAQKKHHKETENKELASNKSRSNSRGDR